MTTHTQNDAHSTERGTSLTLVQQADTHQRHHDSDDRHCRNTLLEEHRHNHSHHNGINKQDSRSNARIHEMETLVIGNARSSEQNSQREQHLKLMASHFEILPLDEHDHSQQDDCEPETMSQHRCRIDAFLIQRQRTERVRAITHGRENGTQDANGFTLFHLYYDLKFLMTASA